MATVTDVVLARLNRQKFATGTPEEDLLFAAYCINNMHMSYSQRLQDLWVLYELGEKRDGYFVDFGAGNGRDSSNSYILHRKYGWTGILVEPNIDYQDNLQHHASHGVTIITGTAVAAETKSDVDFLVSSDPSISTLHYSVDADAHGRLRRDLPSETRKIRTVTLTDLLDEYSDAEEMIDYLSIDTEGSEFDILSKFFSDEDSREYFQTHPIRLITVEHNYNHDARLKINRLLTKSGFIQRFPHYSGHDDWYVHEDAMRALR